MKSDVFETDIGAVSSANVTERACLAENWGSQKCMYYTKW